MPARKPNSAVTQTRGDGSHAANGTVHADEERKPQSPTSLEKRSWKYLLKRTVREFISDQCPDIAATLTYYGVLALFPFLLAVFSLLGVLNRGPEVARAVLEIVDELVPGGAAEVLRGPIEQFASAPAAGIALIVGLGVAIWSASGYVGAFARAMNRIYEIDEGRPIWKLKPAQLLLTLVVIVIVALAGLILVLSGPVVEAIGNVVGLGETATLIWSIAKWPVLVFLLIILLALLYYSSPNVKQPKFRWISLGAVLALVVMALATFGFAIYVANFSNYDRTYGAFAGVIIFLLWVWIMNIAILFGAEFDAELERGRQLQGGIPAERQIQLPLRDEKKIVKARAQDEEEAQEGRRIRESADGAKADSDGV